MHLLLILNASKKLFVFLPAAAVSSACCCNFQSLVASRALTRVRCIVSLPPLLNIHAADTCAAAAAAAAVAIAAAATGAESRMSMYVMVWSSF